MQVFTCIATVDALTGLPFECPLPALVSVCFGALVVARFRVTRSSADDRLQRPMSGERRECGLVGCTVVDDLQGRLGQPERLRKQRSIREVEQSDLKLKCQVVERSQDSAICRLSNCPMLHCTALGRRIVRWNADFGEDRLQRLAESRNEGSTIPCWHHYGQQASLADSEHNLDSANADQIGVPVAEDCVRRCRLWIRRRLQPVEELMGASKDKHSAEMERQMASIEVDQCFLSAVVRSYLSYDIEWPVMNVAVAQDSSSSDSVQPDAEVLRTSAQQRLRLLIQPSPPTNS